MKTREFIRENNRWIGNGTGLISGTLMGYLRRKAKERGLCFEVSSEELWRLFVEQKGKCALSGLEITLSREINHQNNLNRKLITASLDRIDNSKCYTIDNLRWVHKDINLMRRQYDSEYYIKMCKLVAEYNR